MLPNLGPSTMAHFCALFPALPTSNNFILLLHLLFTTCPVCEGFSVIMLLHSKHEKAKQLTGKQHFIYSRQKFNTVFSSCLEVIISRMYLLYIW